MKILSLAAFAFCMMSSVVLAEPNLGTFDGTANSDSAAEAGANNVTTVGGNNFDFSNSNSSLRVSPPGLANIAAGPCGGGGVTGSLSVTGVALGVGKQKIDESCDRRAWVQTLLGAAQQVSDQDATILRAVAVKVMQGDPIVGDAFSELGYGDDAVKAAAPKNKASKKDKAQPNVHLSTQSSPAAEQCNVAVEHSAPAAYIAAVKARGCDVLFVSTGNSVTQ